MTELLPSTPFPPPSSSSEGRKGPIEPQKKSRWQVFKEKIFTGKKENAPPSSGPMSGQKTGSKVAGLMDRIPKEPQERAQATLSERHVQRESRKLSVGGDVSETLVKAKELGTIALMGDPTQRQEAIEILLHIRDELVKQKHAAPQGAVDQISEDLVFVDSQLQRVFSSQKDEAYTSQQKYGAALGHAIAEGKSDQDVVDQFALHVMDIRRRYGDTKDAEAILGSMEEIISRKRPSAHQNACDMVTFLKLGSSNKEDDPKRFVAFGKHSPALAFQALRLLAAKNPAGFSNVKATIEASDWQEGKAFLLLQEAKACFDEGQVGQKTESILKSIKSISIKTFRGDGEGAVLLREAGKSMIESMLKYCERCRPSSAVPSMHFVYENFSSIANCLADAKSWIGEKTFDDIVAKYPEVQRWLIGPFEKVVAGSYQDDFSTPLPKFFENPKLQQVKVRAEKLGEQDKQKVLAWADAFGDPTQVSRDLFSHAIFDDQSLGEGDLALASFAEKIFQSVPEAKRTPEVRKAIGRACLMATQGFAPYGTPFRMISELQSRFGAQYQMPVIKQTPMRVTITPDGVCKISFDVTVEIKDMQKKDEALSKQGGTEPKWPKVVISNTIEVVPGEDVAHCTFRVSKPEA